MKWYLIVLLFMFVLPAPVLAADTTADPSDVLAKMVLEKAGIHVGVCELPRVGDGTLAAALARAGVAQVHGIALDAGAIEVARKPAEKDNTLGSQVVIETGSPAVLPLGDWVADLLVVADATDANMKELSAAEVCRVLSPYRGVAVVGNPKAGRSKLSQKALKTWAETVGGTAEVKEDGTGLWAVVRMPPLEGGDDWSHIFHAADENKVSQDTAFSGPPMQMQWTGNPYNGGQNDTHVISAGRIFSAQSSVQRAAGLPYELVARSAYNGMVLWKRPISKDFGERSSLVAATPERLFLKDQNAVLVLQPETGAEIRRIVATNDEKQRCLWLLVSEGVLLTLTGDIEKYDKTAAANEANENLMGQELAAWNITDGKELWRFKEEKIDPCKLAVSDGHVFLFAKLSYAACLNLKTGDQLWKTDAPLGAATGLKKLIPDAGDYYYRNGAIATKDVYFINYAPHRQCQAFAASDGHLLWAKMRGSDDPKQTGDALFNFPLVLGKTIIERRWGGTTELLTGKLLPGKIEFNYSGCGWFNAVSNGFLIGQCGELFSIKDNKRVLFYNAKSPCSVSQFVADGLLLKVSGACYTCYEWRGFVASRSVPRRDLRTGVRFEQGPAGNLADVSSDANDWPTYRADVTRRGSSSAAVPAEGAIRWTYTPARPDKSLLTAGGQYSLEGNAAPPVAVGDRLWFGTASDAVICLDQKTGNEMWRYWTAGRIMSAPTWWQGRLLVGSADGWIYCLDASTGALAWRYRIAPEDRRVLVFGRLFSAWPVMANILVQDGVAYATAGLIGQLDGTMVCALDARTGKLRWEQRFNDPLDAPTAGQLAWDDGKLWWHAGAYGLAWIDPANGEMHRMASSGFAPTCGQDIGILQNGWVVLGGRQFNLPLDRVTQPTWGYTCTFLRETNTIGLQLNKIHEYDNIPVWDAKEVLLFGKPAGWQTNPLPPIFCSNLCSSLTTNADAQPFDPAKKNSATNAPRREINWQPTADQQRPVLPDKFALGSNFRLQSSVLSGNAAVFIREKGQDWHLFAISRVDQTILCNVKLPAKPVDGGMALTRAGDVLVPLIDGRVVCIGGKEKP